MLVYQGAASFELWTTVQPPLDVMFKAARKALAPAAAKGSED
jgi:shikimate 5-dehydrogenase